MGIQGLAKLIADNAPNAIKENVMKAYFGRKVAVDASMSIYQFLIAVRSEGNMLMNEAGETTSHLVGFFYRTIRMMESGLKPVYVFDGKPPQLKRDELAKRSERRDEAQEKLETAQEEGTSESVEKYSKRLIKVTKQHNDECKKLLKLMGVPYIDASGEAEAQCAALVRAGKVFAVGTEDMDALTFGANVLLRHLTFSEARKMPIKEFHLDKVLQGLEMNMDEFIDLCILLGCDYCSTIKGVGPVRAMTLIKQYRSIEKVLENLDSKYEVPADWNFKGARELFKNPDVHDANEMDLKWEVPDEDALVAFMVGEKGFSEDRIRSGAKKLTSAKNTATQGRLDNFFTVSSIVSSKRPIEEADKNKKNKVDSKGKGKAFPKKK